MRKRLLASLLVGLMVAQAACLDVLVAEPVFSQRCSLDLDPKENPGADLPDNLCPLQRWSSLEYFDQRVAHSLASQTAISLATDFPMPKPGQTLSYGLKTGSFNGQAAVGLSGLYVMDRNADAFDEVGIFAGFGASLTAPDLRGKLGMRIGW